MRDGSALHSRRTPRSLAGQAWRQATAFARVEPSFLLIGAPRAGTTSFFSYLTRHPGVLGPAAKEIWFFNSPQRYRRGPSFYRSHFPLVTAVRRARSRLGVEPAVGEATPAYLCHPHAPARVHAFNPEMKLIALLRDPVDRTYSAFRKRPRLTEGLTFEQALDQEEERVRGEFERMEADPSYVSTAFQRYAHLFRSRYAEQLERWLAVFPREQLLILSVEELVRDPAGVVQETTRFLGLPDAPLPGGGFPRLNAGPEASLAAETRERLAEYFAEPNRRLYELAGRDFGWTRPAGRAAS